MSDAMTVLSTVGGVDQSTVSAEVLKTLDWLKTRIEACEAVEEKGENYIRFKGGLQICFDRTPFPDPGEYIINFAKPFSAIPRVTNSEAQQLNQTFIYNITTTNFAAKNEWDENKNNSINWIAVGYWK